MNVHKAARYATDENEIKGVKGGMRRDLIISIFLTEGYLNQLLLVDALAAYMRMKPDRRSMKESAMVANSDRDFDEMAAYNCRRNSSTLTPIEP